MRINNNFNVLPFYDSLQKQNSKKWYSFGQHYPLICPNNTILPFQFITDSEVTVSSNIEAVNVHSGKVTNLGVKPSVSKGTQADATYYIVKMVETTISAMPEGLHYLRINTNKGYLYSEEFTFNANHEECIKIEYWNENTLNFNSGEINFDDDFRFILYIPSTIGKPEYEFEEELTKRLGYKFIESQTSNKIYKFNFLAPEYICDAMRLIRLCDYIKLTTKYDTFNALSFAYEPKWQDNGDLAAVDVEFDTDCIIQKLESFNRRLKESFYNALLADIDEPVLFSNDIVAQYYTEFTTTSYINGKLIRQLEAINEADLGSLENLVLPIDNQVDTEQKAKKITLASLKNVLIKLADYVTLTTAQNINGEKNFIGGLKVNGSPIIYDSVNKCWKLQGNLVLTGGITMYADDGTLNLPSIYDGLPIDGTTIYWDTDAAGNRVLKAVGGGGTAESVAWNNITGKPSWIGSSKPTYSYSEIQNTPDLSVYQPKITSSNKLAYSFISGVPTKLSDFTDDIVSGNYLPINGVAESAKKLQTAKTIWGQSFDGTGNVSGNVTGSYFTIGDRNNAYIELKGGSSFGYLQILADGSIAMGASASKSIIVDSSGNVGIGTTNPNYKLDVNGSISASSDLYVNGGKIKYDSTNKYWKIEGDLLVTGGITMYGNEGTYTPSTIMDAIEVDGTTISKSGGVLKVIGGTGGGVADSVAWANITGKPNFASVATSGKYDDLIGKPTLLSSFTDDVVSGKYLPLSGGTLSNTLTISNYNVGLILYRSGKTTPYMRFGENANNEYGEIGVYNDGRLVYWPLVSTQGGYNQWNTVWHEGNDGSGSGLDADLLDGKHATAFALSNNDIKLDSFINQIGYGYKSQGWYESGAAMMFGANSSYYMLLQGASDGSKIYLRANYVNNGSYVGWKDIAFTDSNVASATKLQTARTIWGQSFDGTGNVSGNVKGSYFTIGDRDNAYIELFGGTNYGYVQILADGSMAVGSSTSSSIIVNKSGNVGIGTTSPSYKLDVATSAKFANIICEKDDEINRYGGHLYIQHRGTVEGSQGTARTGNVMMCAQGGNVGIGKVNPSYKLDVYGITQSTALKTNSLYFECDSSGNTSDRGGEINRYAGSLHLQYATNKNITLCFGGGNVGVAIVEPKSKLDVYGVIRSRAYDAIGNNNAAFLFDKVGANYTGIGASGILDTIYFGACNETGAWVDYTQIWKFGGNILTTGGITMYSDQRKKTILNHVELSLKQIANAPLIEHYYNSDEKKTTHVGSIAQYWYGLNDWFCKMDSEGFFTMEIQNAALASAISIARELVRYETKTDKAIKKLKKRISELEDEVERLKCA